MRSYCISETPRPTEHLEHTAKEGARAALVEDPNSDEKGKDCDVNEERKDRRVVHSDDDGVGHDESC